MTMRHALLATAAACVPLTAVADGHEGERGVSALVPDAPATVTP